MNGLKELLKTFGVDIDEERKNDPNYQAKGKQAVSKETQERIRDENIKKIMTDGKKRGNKSSSSSSSSSSTSSEEEKKQEVKVKSKQP